MRRKTARPPRQWRRPSSEAVHRLAWWLAADDARWLELTAEAEISPPTIDRLLSGELEPGGWLVQAIARATDGAVLPMDWERATPAAWDVKPAARAEGVA
ncbi:MAG: hypothetical protein P0Y64_01990 [Candidatus Sphingomonas colombiensis]|nr:hypothetical protein [Sphingomonas sp.]WEK43626.1 MAG: hypothetical protein P0Y64_01990 [Sphingomonas sp.]